MATKKVTWGTIGMSFGIALMISIFGLTATSLTNMSPLVFRICILLAILAIVSFGLGYRLLTTGIASLDQENKEKDQRLIESFKQAMKEALKEHREQGDKE